MNNIERQIQELKEQLLHLEELKNSLFTANDLIEFLKETKYSSFISGETWQVFLNDRAAEKNMVEKIGAFTLVFSDSDYDEGCNPISNVYFFEKLNCFVQFNGYYASYDGYHFEDCFLVEPEEYIAIRYNKI